MVIPPSNPDPLPGFDVAFALANDLLYRDAPNALRALKELFDSTSLSAGDSRRAQLLERMSLAQRILGDYRTSERQAREALEFYEQQGDDMGASRIFVALGNLDWSRGDLPEALAYYETAYELRESLDDIGATAGALASVANVLSELKRPEDALPHYEKALAIWIELKDVRFAARTHNNLADCLLQLNELELALDHAHTALRLSRAVDDSGDEANILINIGLILGRQHAWQEAMDTLDEAAASAALNGDPRGEAEAMLHRSRLTEDRGRIDPGYIRQAELYRQEAMALSLAIGAKDLTRQLHEDCAVAADRRGDKSKSEFHRASANVIGASGPVEP